MTQLPIKQGIDGLPTANIPTDPQAFVDWFKNSFLPRWAANADIRNATAGVGVQISGDSNSPGFVGFEEIDGNSVLGNPTGTEGDVQPITAGADGEYLQRSSGSLVFASVSVTSIDSITGSGSSTSPLKLINDVASPGNSEYYGTDVSGNKGFFQLPAAGGSNLQTFSQSGGASQTWTKPASCNYVRVICIGGGGGGAGGGKGVVSSSPGNGGGGGASGGRTDFEFRSADLPATAIVAFSSVTGGAGGAGATVGGTNGANGTAGSNVSFGGLMSAPGGGGGLGSTTNGTASNLGWILGLNGGAGGNSSNGGAAPANALGFGATALSCTGGGGGGSVSAASFAFTGGNGGSTNLFVTPTVIVGGAGGAAGVSGSNGTNGGATYMALGGGGGGAGAGAVVGGKGGNGGNFGGGGGGGGASQATGGAGGNGGPAACIIIAW